MATTQTSLSTKGFRFPAKWRKSVLIVHIISGIGWMGVDIALALLLITGLRTDDGLQAASSYNAIAIFAPPVLLTLSALMLGSGIALGWGTKWGLIRYWWVAVKLAIALLMTGLVWFSLAPELSAIEPYATSMSADAIRDHLGSATIQLLFPPFVSFTMLLVSVVLSVFKP